MKHEFDAAYRQARAAGLQAQAARELADRVVQRVVLGGETRQLAVEDELRKVGK